MGKYPISAWTSLKPEYPEVEAATRFVNADRTMYKNGDLRFYEDKVFFADSSLFNMFTYQFIEGNPKTALVEPNSMVLTQSLAEKYFGKKKSAIGKSLQNGSGDVYKITGVVKDVPKNSHIIFNALISVTTLPKDFANNWGGFGFYNYVLLKPNTNAAQFQKKLLSMYDKYMASIFTQFNVKIHYGVQPITSIHLHSDMAGEPEELGSMSYIYIFSAVALFMIIIACINYMNLTTARSARRAKEIGIRKVTGSSQTQLVAQFLVESTLTALFALVLSIGFIALFLSIWAGLTVLMNQYLQAHGGKPVGDINPLLYRIAAGSKLPGFRDVSLGGNAVDVSAPGYDLVSGLGSPNAANLARNLLDLSVRGCPPMTGTDSSPSG